MTQLFRNDEMCELFYEICKVAKQDNFITELIKMSKSVTSSKMFGYALYDSNAFPEMSNLSREFFAENYVAILEAMMRAGVFDSYILLIRQILGDSISIEHEIPNPGHLRFKLSGIESDEQKITTDSELWICTDSGLGILATTPISNFTLNQTIKTIENICQPGGIFVEIDVIVPDSISMAHEDIAVGESAQFTATLFYSDGSSKTSTDYPNLFAWSSSDESIAIVDATGVVTVLAEGIVDITVTSGALDETEQLDLVVRPDVEILFETTFDATESGLATGEKIQDVTETFDHFVASTSNGYYILFSKDDGSFIEITPQLSGITSDIAYSSITDLIYLSTGGTYGDGSLAAASESDLRAGTASRDVVVTIPAAEDGSSPGPLLMTINGDDLIYVDSATKQVCLTDINGSFRQVLIDSTSYTGYDLATYGDFLYTTKQSGSTAYYIQAYSLSELKNGNSTMLWQKNIIDIGTASQYSGMVASGENEFFTFVYHGSSYDAIKFKLNNTNS